MDNDIKDLKVFSKIGCALWMDQEHSKSLCLETLTAVSLLDLTPERAIEKAAAILLEKAKKADFIIAQKNSKLLLNGFYRLKPEERLILAALHQESWSYSRIARILQLDVIQVEEIAWRARLQVVSSIPSSAAPLYPSAPYSLSLKCPDYEITRPWTQRFLDDEISSPRDRLFLQNHLFSCVHCREALNRSRIVFSKVDQNLLDVIGDSDFSEAMKKIFHLGALMRNPSQLSFKESLEYFLNKKDVQRVLIVLGFLIAIKIGMQR